MENERLQKIQSFYKNNRRLPSYSEMLSLFSLSSKNAIHKIVAGLIEEGFLQKNQGKLSPTGKFFSLPFLGQVKAGFPTEAAEDLDLLSLDEYLIEKPNSSFLLKVSGDSLLGLGILPGDLVIIEKKNSAHPEEIVLAQIDNEWTLKIFKKENGKIFLASANDKYPPFYPVEELKIFGAVKGVVRKVK